MTRAPVYAAKALRRLLQDERAKKFPRDGDSSSDAAPAPNGARILLAHNSPDMLDYLVRLLSPRWEVEPVANGLAALDAARRRRPDLVLVDEMMSGLGGLELVAALRRDPKFTHVSVILLTTGAGQQARIKGLEAGADDCLVKPFAARELLARVKSLLALSRLRRAAAERARRSEARLHAAIDLVGLGIYSWDPVTNALEWDDRLRAMWGLPPGAPVNMDVFMAGIYAQDRPRVEAAIAACTDPSGDGVYAIEYRTIGIDNGAERWISTHGKTVFEDGRPVTFNGAALEITERKNGEERLRRSEAYLSAILEQLPIGVAVFDTDGHLTLGNKALGNFVVDEISSRSPEKAARWQSFRPDGSIVQAQDYPGAKALRGEVTMPGLSFLYTHFDGRAVWTRVSGSPLRDKTGVVTGAVVIIQDIDHEKRANAALRESEERFRQFANHSTDVLWIINAETMRIEYLSRAFETIWGEPPEALLKDTTHWATTVHPDDRAGALDAMDRVLRSEFVVQEYRIVRPDGNLRWIRATFFPIRDDKGQMRRIGGIAEDITRHSGSQVYVVSPDDTSRPRLSLMLQRAGYNVKEFASGRTFIKVAQVLVAGCVVLDIRAPAAGGSAILRELKARRIGLPVIVTGDSQGDVGAVVQAMKAGAVDWLEAPCEADALLVAVAEALANMPEPPTADTAAELARTRIAGMSVREREVLAGLMGGDTNKTIARRLGISPRTVEIHRAHVMERFGVRTLTEAVLLASSAGLSSSDLPAGPAGGPPSGRRATASDD